MKFEDLSLAEIVTAKPAAAALFDNMQLDFCCRGNQKLNEALSNDPSKLKQVILELDKIFHNENSEPDVSSYSLTQLADYIIEKHHTYVKKSIPIIQQHLNKIILKHGENSPEMITIEKLFHELSCDLEIHMKKEETILFPLIRKIELNGNQKDENELASIASIIDIMEKEHEIAGTILKEINKLSKAYTPPENSCLTFSVSLNELKIFEADLHKHIHLENNILFPQAINLQNNAKGPSNMCSI